MFVVNGTTIDMHRGDTGSIVITASGYTFESQDRALFTVKAGNGSVIIERYYEMTNNAFTVQFDNPDTDYLTPGDYSWDVRYIVAPVYDEQQHIIDGTDVTTPHDPMTLHIRNTVGQI